MDVNFFELCLPYACAVYYDISLFDHNRNLP